MQDIPHDLRLDEGVVLGEISVQFLDLVLQVLHLHLQTLWQEMRGAVDTTQSSVEEWLPARQLDVNEEGVGSHNPAVAQPPHPIGILVLAAVLCEGCVLTLRQEHLRVNETVWRGFLDRRP